jgi:hypothetical protein
VKMKSHIKMLLTLFVSSQKPNHPFCSTVKSIEFNKIDFVKSKLNKINLFWNIST